MQAGEGRRLTRRNEDHNAIQSPAWVVAPRQKHRHPSDADINALNSFHCCCLDIKEIHALLKRSCLFDDVVNDRKTQCGRTWTQLAGTIGATVESATQTAA
jgi:hypothetical protein